MGGKSFIKGLPSLNAKHRLFIERLITWMGPAIAIPMFRYSRDPIETRDKLAVRDFTTGAIGAVFFFLPAMLLWGVTKYMPKQMSPIVKWAKQNPLQKHVVTLGAGLAAYTVFAGIGAIKISEWFDKNFNKSTSSLLAASEILRKNALTPTGEGSMIIRSKPPRQQPFRGLPQTYTQPPLVSPPYPMYRTMATMPYYRRGYYL